jgi:hypothetical protein
MVGSSPVVDPDREATRTPAPRVAVAGVGLVGDALTYRLILRTYVDAGGGVVVVLQL